MSSHYSDEEVNQIAAAALDRYPQVSLHEFYRGFLWQGVGLPVAWSKRNALELQLKTALRSGNLASLRTAADDIHTWGFGSGIPSALDVSPGFWGDLQRALKAFQAASGGALLMCEKPLAGLLEHQRLGIAKVSKWVCFVDQSRYAIFDSRVSIALRSVTTADGQRAFPIVGRRPSGGRSAWPANSEVLSSPSRTARCYIDYLRVIETVSSAVSPQSPAQVEMALFMAGNVWPSGNPQLPPLQRGMWI